ncbi:hypothetical protein J6590_054004 [Homalodisca vitripennis]|nr:hypothetical protein J6590_054004 [Homalodisca vitripennis]
MAALIVPRAPHADPHPSRSSGQWLRVGSRRREDLHFIPGHRIGRGRPLFVGHNGQLPRGHGAERRSAVDAPPRYDMKTNSGLSDTHLFSASRHPWHYGNRSDTGGEVRVKKPSLTLNGNGLKVTSEPPPTAGQAGCLQGQDRSAVTNPSSSHARRCTRYATPLACLSHMFVGHLENEKSYGFENFRATS